MNKIKLYHYSNIKIKDKIDPAFFGENSYTENSRRISEIKRAYFYLKDSQREYWFAGAKYCYIVEVEKNKLYNLNKDKLNLYELFLSADDLIKRIKAKGFKGFFDNAGLGIVCLFKAVKIIKKIALTK